MNYQLLRSRNLGSGCGFRMCGFRNSKGDDAHLRKAIRDFAANDKKINPEYRMMDVMAGSIISGISDRMWTEATGRRTPLGGLGTFWDDAAKSQPTMNIDDLL